MSNSYRIRTKLGVNHSINVQLEQDYEFLEILSLKITQSQIYTRQCADYGVIVGRLTANDGFGIPNARISVFLPLSDQDESNPIISDLYPYRSLTSTNDDGFRYNLLPKTQSHSGHVPVGSFFDKEEVLVNPNYIEVFDKYYKYTTVTNDSGDYMIFGVPIGSQTIHVDVDLSDIGEFSLAPQDLIRMGIATEAQVAGTKFRKSTNLNELPQIISFNRTLEVVPLWGQPEVCNLGITRTDFDLASEANVTITPTAIFMGSIFSTNDKDYQRRNCKPKSKQGELCNLVAGPGEILAIRQTIFEDDLGRPILETYDLESGGQVIDENGAWLVDIPMNLDYVITNEFGDRILSNDPKRGIPTKGKYRFKIKWNQSPKLSETIKRAYFLVPNVREYGWDNINQDPLSNSSNQGYNNAVKSYAFSVDWNDYGNTGTTIGQTMIQDAIDCEDKFYPMIYNKVYTITQLIDQYRNGYLPDRIISVKNILDDTCESENVRFPTNDAFFRFDLLYLLFIILVFIIRPILFIFLHVAHFVAFLLKTFNDPNWRKIAFMEIPNLTYPECDLCECNEGKTYLGPGPTTEELAIDINLSIRAYLSPLTQFSNYDGNITDGGALFGIQQLLSGNNGLGVNFRSPQLETVFTNGPLNSTGKGFTNSLPIWERINLFNIKSKYYNSDFTNNPGGGYNRIKVNFSPTENGYFGSGFLQQYGLDNLDIKVEGNASFTGINATTQLVVNPIVFTSQSYQPTLAPNPWNSVTNSYVVPENGTYIITLTTEILSSFTSGQKNFYLMKNGVELHPVVPDVTWTPGFRQTSYTISLPLLQNDTISVRYTQTGNPLVINFSYSLEIKGQPNGYGNSNMKYHLDQAMVLMVKPDKISELTPGTILSFQNPELSRDINVSGFTTQNQFGTSSSTGTTKFNGTSTIFVPYANPDCSGDWLGPGGFNPSALENSVYQITQNNTNQQHKFAIDIEYFQVITAITVNDYINMYQPGAIDGLGNRIIDGFSIFHVVNQSDRCYNTNFVGWPKSTRALRNFKDYSDQVIVFMVRGVDPYSDRIEVEYDLSRLFGYSLDSLGRPNGPHIVRGNRYKMNIPIKGRYAAVRHYAAGAESNDPHTNQFLYYPSFAYQDSIVGDARFSGFSSNLPAFYSSLGTNTPTNYFTGANLLRDTLIDGFANFPPPNTFFPTYLKVQGAPVKTQPPYLPCERQMRNAFQVVLRNYTTVPCQWLEANNNVPEEYPTPPINQNQMQFEGFANTGYFPNEIVDGGSYISGEYDKETTGCGNDMRFISWYYSPTYNRNSTMDFSQMANNDKIVMRSDRLPTSTNTFDNLQNSYAWQANINFGTWIISDDGSFVAGTGSPVGSPTFNNIAQIIEEQSLQVLESFNCQSLVPLGCYYVPSQATEIAIRQTGNNCYTNGYNNELIMRDGCYVLITAPFDSLGKDIEILWEWTSRIQINFAACRNVFSHLFTNNWINGSLFAFAIQNSRLFDSNNQPFSVYCKDTIHLDPTTNNFYYRSSPFKTQVINNQYTVTIFPGSPKPTPPIGFLGDYKGNRRNLKFPTTMIDLGPRSQYLQELVFTNDFDGYLANRLRDTSYQDVSEILNSLIINRLTNKSVLNRFVNRTAANILLFFDNNRDTLFVDGDYSQMISISSELGVVEFNSINYPSIGGPFDQDPLFFNNPNSSDPTIGIFFSSDTQTRDFISPRRTILNPNLPITGNLSCSFDNIGVFSQEVPFYQWEIQENRGNTGDSIFGSERNDWYSNWIEQYVNDNSQLSYQQSFFKFRYQSLDRLYKQSRYYRPGAIGNPNISDFKGYIFSINRNTQNPPLISPEFDVRYNPPIGLPAQPNDPDSRIFQVGAPFFFYFGLKKGKTAFDRFAKKWIDFNNIVE